MLKKTLTPHNQNGGNMNPQEMLKHLKEREVFKRLMEESAIDADLPLHEKVKADEYSQRTYGNKYVSDTNITKASDWIASFLKAK